MSLRAVGAPRGVGCLCGEKGAHPMDNFEVLPVMHAADLVKGLFVALNL